MKLALFLFLCVLVSGAYAGIDETADASDPRWQALAAQLKEAFLRCRTMQDREAVADSHLGTVLRTQDGGEIAVAYSDEHIIPIASASVALTSDDQWLICEYHFCAGIVGYRWTEKKLGLSRLSSQEAEEELSKLNRVQRPVVSLFYAVEKSRTLSEGIQKLESFGFKLVNKDSIGVREGEPGATDNPDSAGFQPEKSSSI